LQVFSSCKKIEDSVSGGADGSLAKCIHCVTIIFWIRIIGPNNITLMVEIILISLSPSLPQLAGDLETT